MTSSCVGSRAPTTTALRYIQNLCEQDIVERMPDDCDRRRNWLRLTPSGRTALDQYLDQVLESLDRHEVSPAPRNARSPDL